MEDKTKSPYRYYKRGRNWNIYKNCERSMSADYVKTCFTKEEARAEVYRLNGWKLESIKYK